jgi:hypothetical protein
MSNVSRQLPLTEMLHVPARSPLGLVDAPAGRPGHAAHVGRRDQHRENVAQPPHQIVAELPAVIVFNEAQQAPVRDAPMEPPAGNKGSRAHVVAGAITVVVARPRLQPLVPLRLLLSPVCRRLLDKT